jgi:class 3 adenylate cyclase
MKCPQCAHDNPAEQKFCGECGTRLELRCPACQAPNSPANKFCGECGQKLVASPAPAPVAPAPAPSDPAPAAPERFASPQTYTPKHLAEKILTSRSAMEGERKQVTVLFTDVSGFTSMSSSLDPEEVHEIMDRCFEVVLGAVHRYVGTINQFLGDGVMALFGAPIAHEDHPHRALRAGLAIQRDLLPLREDVRRAHGVDFRVRIGVNTGLVVVGAIGKDLRMDYTAVGDTTNLAARLLNIAQPGQIALSRPTHRLTEGYFTLRRRA